MKSMHVLAAAALAFAALAAGAQTQAPGLWEHTFNMKSAGGEMEKALAEMTRQLDAMPADQRQQVEQMMAARGMKLGAQGTSVKFCLSKEQAARPAEPRLNDSCTQQVERRSGNTVKFRFECTRPQPSSGEGEMTYSGDKAYSGKADLTSQINGKPQQISMELSGKWLSADCGDVKPRAAAQ